MNAGPLADSMVALANALRRVTVRIHDGGTARGSGVVWARHGVIVTNAHVVHGHATVVLLDGRAFEARVRAWDPERDLAALAIDMDLPPAEIDDSDRLRVGELVIAVGHPFGISGAVTAGLVHACAPRERLAPARWIQTDLRLAPGNSGGPLANVRGKVVGVNSMMAGGLGLAVPSNVVGRFLRGAGVIRDGLARPSVPHATAR